jgi:hypothetical protein
MKIQRVTIHFDGWDDSKNYVVELIGEREMFEDPDIFPVGWCSANRRKLQPPKRTDRPKDIVIAGIAERAPYISSREPWSDWKTYLNQVHAQAVPLIHFDPSKQDGVEAAHMHILGAPLRPYARAWSAPSPKFDDPSFLSPEDLVVAHGDTLFKADDLGRDGWHHPEDIFQATGATKNDDYEEVDDYGEVGVVPVGGKNDAGLTVRFGTAGDTFYCGRRRTDTGGGEGVGTDDRCGPNNGPNCGSCKRAQGSKKFRKLMHRRASKVEVRCSLLHNVTLQDP